MSVLLPEHRTSIGIDAYRRITGRQPSLNAANILDRLVDREKLRPEDAELRILILVLAASDIAALKLEEEAAMMRRLNTTMSDTLQRSRAEFFARELEIAKDMKAHISKSSAKTDEFERLFASNISANTGLLNQIKTKFIARHRLQFVITYALIFSNICFILIAASLMRAR